MIVGGTNASANSQPTGPRKHPSVERYASFRVSSRPSITVPIIGDTAAHPTEPITNQPSGVIGVPRSTIGGGGGMLGTVDCPYAGANAPAMLAIASNTAPASLPMHPPNGRKHSTRPLVVHHARPVQEFT